MQPLEIGGSLRRRRDRWCMVVVLSLIHILFAHAANGGIRIREDASTEVEGLFACGEVTGGMHGADRIGGCLLYTSRCV